MSNFDWSRFVLRVTVNAPAQKLYKAWATSAGMEEWFLRSCIYTNQKGVTRAPGEYVLKDDTYRWLWHGWPDEVVETGSILESNGSDSIRFRFGMAGDCSVRITESEGIHIVELIQENIPTDETGMKNYHLGCKTGWTFYLANLKSVLEGGLDLRNKNEKIQHVINS